MHGHVAPYLACNKHQIRQCIKGMCDALPYQVDYVATSFADGFVYRADEDMLVPADLFAGCCHRYICTRYYA